MSPPGYDRTLDEPSCEVCLTFGSGSGRIENPSLSLRSRLSARKRTYLRWADPNFAMKGLQPDQRPRTALFKALPALNLGRFEAAI